jgi:exonuclease VII large subunit
MTNSTDTKSNGAKITIIILAILLATLGFFSYQNFVKNKESEEVLLEEKLKIQSELNNKIIELDNAIAENTSLDIELTSARDNIVAFRDSVKNLKKLNYNIIRRYKAKLAVLEVSNRRLLKITDSLKIANFKISIERDSAQATVDKQATTILSQYRKNDSLSSKNNNLNHKIEKGSALYVDNVSVIAMKERRGKLKETSRARRTDAFRISFKIRENAIAKSGLKKVYIVIQDAAGNVLSSMGDFNDNHNVKVKYSDMTDVEYNKQDIEVITVTTLSEEKLPKGDYYIQIYVENKLLGSTKVYLK